MKRITDTAIQPFETEHFAAVRQAGPECALFLKKDSTTLPLTAGSVALYGCGARKTQKGGTGSGDVNTRTAASVEEALIHAGFTITSQAWLDAYDNLLKDAHTHFVEQIRQEAAAAGANAFMYSMGKVMPEPAYEFPLDAPGDTALYILSRVSGEGSDRTVTEGDTQLTETEIRDILFCTHHYKRFVLVLNTAGVIDLGPISAVKNVLLLGQLGAPTGDVLADILLGKSNPSGKLAATWAPLKAYPSTEGFGDPDDTAYKEGIYVGYRYFEKAAIAPTYPFGFGLSYTDFSIETESVAADGLNITVTAKVKNIGSYPGKEVVQVYLSAPSGKLEKPVKELAAFVKTEELRPGAGQTVTLLFALPELASYDEASACYLLEKGGYIVWIGNSSADANPCAVLTLAQDVVTRKCKNCFASPVRPEEISLADTAAQTEFRKAVLGNEALPHILLNTDDVQTENVKYSKAPAEAEANNSFTWEDVTSGHATVEQFVHGLTIRQLASVCTGRYDTKGGFASMIGANARTVAGAAGETTDQLAEQGVPSLVMADGPAGLRLCTSYKAVDGFEKSTESPLAGIMEFMEPAQAKIMQAMLPKPTEEEKAPVCYHYCIAIPVGTALAQSFNTALCQKMASIVGEEMQMFGIHLWLAPAMNIQRSPLCGRDFEYYSEDPLLSGKIAAAIVNGTQSHSGCGAVIKHFALNNQETNRIASNSIVSERAIREIYLRAFEVCLHDADPAAVMSSYNLINGVHANSSRELLTDILRDEWGYDGFVMTDWYAANELMIATSGRSNKHAGTTPPKSVHAGNDLIMPGGAADVDDMCKAVENDEDLTRADLQVSAVRILKAVLKLAET